MQQHIIICTVNYSMHTLSCIHTTQHILLSSTRVCSITAFNNWLLHTRIYSTINRIWITLVSTFRNSARHLTLPETCNNLYCSGLCATRLHTVALGWIRKHTWKGSTNTPQNSAEGSSYEASDVLQMAVTLVALWNSSRGSAEVTDEQCSLLFAQNWRNLLSKSSICSAL